MKITFASLQFDKSLTTWRGSQVPLIGFDQLETFTKKQFFYMLSRNRSKSGVRPYIRATCNPEPGWLADFLSWWIAPDGYADLDRVGKIRWMVRGPGDEIFWADTREALIKEYPGSKPKSVTFIVSTIYDNQELLKIDPDYLSNLQAQDFIDRARLLGDPKRGGNWKIRPAAGLLINRDWIEIVTEQEIPAGGRTVRYFDLAATTLKLKKSDPDYTASVKMKKVGVTYYVLHMTEERLSPAKTDERMKQLAELDGPGVKQKWEREGGASGKRDAYHIATLLDGYDASSERPQGDKITRGKGLSAQALAGNVKLLKGAWNERWLDHMHGQPEWPHDDIWDASTGAYRELSDGGQKARGYKG
jgi:predicted phage terminase large subunit-like protein